MKTLLLILFALLGVVGWSAWKSTATGRAALACERNGGVNADEVSEATTGAIMARCRDGKWVTHP